MGVDDLVPMVLCSVYFLGDKVYIIDIDIFQDNQSSMLLEKNASSYSKKRTRHINSIYFFLERVESGEKKIKYCHTDDTIGKYLTNPLEGARSMKFWEQILSIHPDDDGLNHPNGINPQECVGE